MSLKQQTKVWPLHYRRTSLMGIVSSATDAGRRSVLMPALTEVAVNGALVSVPEASIDLNTPANWDSVAPDYTVAANRAGKDVYVYAIATGLILSANSDSPAGYTTTTSRKIGGFHCLCLSVGTISGHSLTGFLTGDILPASIWDLDHRPVCSPNGMVYSSGADIWVDIYLQSGTGSNTASAYLATITDNRTWLDCVDDLATVGKRLLGDSEFQIVAEGSNQQTNIAGSADPVTSGGHRSTTGATNGTSTSAASPSTDISALSSPAHLAVALNGTAAVDVSVATAGLNTGALIASALQTAIRAAVPWAGGLTVSYGTTYVISCPGSFGSSASVVVTAGSSNDCTAALKFGVANGGVEVSGSLGRRMTSNIGCEDCCGAMWQWLQDTQYKIGGLVDPTVDPTYSWYALPGGKGQLYRQGTGGDIKLLAGGGWNHGSYCGSRARNAVNERWTAVTYIGSRGCARSR